MKNFSITPIGVVKADKTGFSIQVQKEYIPAHSTGKMNSIFKN